MSYWGIRAFQDGVKTFDSKDAANGAIIDAITSVYMAATVKTYPQYAGRTVDTLWISGFFNGAPTVDYSLGYPRVTLNGTSVLGYDGTFLVIVL